MLSIIMHMQDEIAFCCLETTSFPVANISCCTVTFLAYIAILNLVYTQLTISALNPSIFIVTTVHIVWIPTPLLGHSVSLLSIPLHWTLSRRMDPVPWP